MDQIDTSDRTQQRNFGIVMAVAIPVLGLVRWGVHWWRSGEMPDFPVWFLVVGAAFLVVGVVAPPVLRPLLIAWLKLAEVLNWVITRVLLALAFFLLITPARLLVSLFSDDPLKREWDPEADTYWDEPDEQPEEFDRYLNQF